MSVTVARSPLQTVVPLFCRFAPGPFLSCEPHRRDSEMRSETIGGVSIADVRTFCAAVERRPALLNNHHDIRDWICRMHALLGERNEGQHKRARTQMAAAPAPPQAKPQSRIPVPTWTTAQMAPAAPAASAHPTSASAKPLPELAAGGAAAAAALAAVTPTVQRGGLAVPPSPAMSFIAPMSTRAAGAGADAATPAPSVLGRVPLGLSPFLNGGQRAGPTPLPLPVGTALASAGKHVPPNMQNAAAAPPSAAAVAAAGIDAAAGEGPSGGLGAGNPAESDGDEGTGLGGGAASGADVEMIEPAAPSESALGTTPSMGSPPKSTRRMRPRARDGVGEISPSLSTPSFAASPPKSTRRIQPARAHGHSALRPRSAGRLPHVPAADTTPSLPATPRFSASPPKSTKCRRQQRGSLGWSESSSPPPIPSFDAASPPRTVRPAANPNPHLPPGSGSSLGASSARRQTRSHTRAARAAAGPVNVRSPELLLDLDFSEEALNDTMVAASVLGLAAGAPNAVRTDGFALRPPADLPPPRAAPASPAEAPPGSDVQPQPVVLPELDLERFPRMFRQPHSEGAARLREVYSVLRDFQGHLSAHDIEESLPHGKYGPQLVTFLLDLLTSRAYLYTQLEGDTKCWRAV